MNLFGSKKQSTPDAPAPAQPATSGGLMTTKVKSGESTLMTRKSGGGDTFTLITTWGKKDFDLYALVEYMDGSVEVVSCFGTTRHPNEFKLQSSDGNVVHYSGDKTAYGADVPQEVMHITFSPRIRCVVPVVYSAKNSGEGSFYQYQVSTYVIRGYHTNVPTDNSTEMVKVDAVNANKDPNVYTFVSSVITSGREGATIHAIELYSRPHSEYRPTVEQAHVQMDNGEENSDKL